MVTIGTYKGNATISLGESRFPFTFGVAKARLVVDNIDAIKAFVAAQERGKAAHGQVVPMLRDPGEDAADRACEAMGL